MKMMTKLFGWLSRRFPEKLEITMREYKELREEMAAYNIHGQQILELHNRLSKLETNVTQLNTANGFANTSTGPTRLER